MKRITFFLLWLTPFISFSQAWTDEQLDKADTGAEIEYLSDEEKDVLQYINLARLYPKQFAENELAGYASQVQQGKSKRPSKYFKSLEKELNSLQPMEVVAFDKAMYDLAVCFAKESGEKGAVTHTRKNCPYGYRGECCAYGSHTGKDIVMQWLIDEGIKDLGHRRNLLSKDFTVAGAAVRPHKVYKICAVADFR